MGSIVLGSLAAVLLAACGPGSQSETLQFDGAWVRAIPPGMKMTAAYGEFRNPGAEAVVLRSFSSEAFGDVSLHRTETVDGVSQMRLVPELPVPAGGAVALEPGGLHLMLMMPAREIPEGGVITLAVEAADGRRFRFEMPVERR